jgi:MFS family permease
VGKWTAIAILGVAQFVMVLDSSVMNVSISQIVEDLDTTVQGVQLAITLYTLVMAAFMLVGAKIGDIWGRDRAFAVGLAVYGVGSMTTALSPDLAVLLIGWSIVEGLGAILVVPAIAALIAANYEGKDRALAYGIIGGIAAAAIAAGPLIGGWFTTNYSWRVVFAAETVAVIGILLVRHRMRPSPGLARPPVLDVVGAALSASGLAIIVLAVLQSSTWGLIAPKTVPVVAGHEIAPFGFSVVPFLIMGGLGLLWAFEVWERRQARLGRDALLDLHLLGIRHMRGGLSTLFVQQLLILGTFFVLPLYLQLVLGLDAFETGKRLVPMSVMMLIAALLGPRAAARRSPRRVAQAGLLGLGFGALILVDSIDISLTGAEFALGLALFGTGAGLLASQLGNVIMSSVRPDQTNEAGGLQGTAQNLGGSFGTALIGAILLSGLTAGFIDRIAENPALPPEVQTTITASAAASGLDMVSVEAAYEYANAAGLPPEQAREVADDYGSAQLQALKTALFAVAIFAWLGLWFTRKLPGSADEAAANDVAEDDVRAARAAAAVS